jgi:hypothetical protein
MHVRVASARSADLDQDLSGSGSWDRHIDHLRGTSRTNKPYRFHRLSWLLAHFPAKVFIVSSKDFRMVGRRWPAAGMSHVASNIHVAGGRNAFNQRSLNNVQIARLAYSKSMKKCLGIHHRGTEGAKVRMDLSLAWVCGPLMTYGERRTANGERVTLFALKTAKIVNFTTSSNTGDMPRVFMGRTSDQRSKAIL